MQYLVMPVSRIPVVAAPTAAGAATAILILIVCIGIPLYIIARRSYGK